MEELWRRIEAWFNANVPIEDRPEGFGPCSLAPAATEDEIRRAQKKLKGPRLPDDVRESYLVHNGGGWLFENHDLLKVEEIPRKRAGCLSRTEYVRQRYGLQWETLQTTGPMKHEAWNPKWIPLTDSGGPSYVCVDLDPAEGGQTGQVIFVDLDGPLFGRVLASSFREFLATFADELERGLFHWDEEIEMLLREEGWLFRSPGRL